MPWAQRAASASESSVGADLGVDPVVVDDVVAMGRARPRLGERRGIDMADAEIRQIGDQVRSHGEK